MLPSFALNAPKTTIPQRDAEFDALPAEAKEAIYRDLYGTSNYGVKEDDDVIENGLALFDKHLSEISDHDKTNYLLALEKSPDYVNDNDFRLQFLRCELFDPKLAALRFVRYWNEKVKIWGEEKAFHPITSDDFDEEDMLVLNNRAFYGLPQGDKFGRGIFVANPCRYDLRRKNSTVRVMWYMWEYPLRRVETQKNGFVALVSLFPENLNNQNRNLDYTLIHVARFALPIRLAGIHHIVSSRLMQFIIPYILYLAGSEWRQRYKIYGDKSLAFQELEKYGIPKTIIPIELGGDDDTFAFNDYLKERKEQKE